jgi:hypothetical protein
MSTELKLKKGENLVRRYYDDVYFMVRRDVIVDHYRTYLCNRKRTDVRYVQVYPFEDVKRYSPKRYKEVWFISAEDFKQYAARNINTGEVAKKVAEVWAQVPDEKIKEIFDVFIKKNKEAE